MSDRRRRFPEEYVVDFNATQAAIRSGYSPRSAHVTGSRLLKDPKIRRRVDVLMDQFSMSAAEVQARMTAQARGELPTKRREHRDGDTLVTVEEYDSHTALDKMARARGIYEGEDPLLGRILVVRHPREALAELGIEVENVQELEGVVVGTMPKRLPPATNGESG